MKADKKTEIKSGQYLKRDFLRYFIAAVIASIIVFLLSQLLNRTGLIDRLIVLPSNETTLTATTTPLQPTVSPSPTTESKGQ
jgi:hypothetical protein